MEGRYAVIGWGSLIWDLEILSPHVDLPWKFEAGPTLPMEFSRISAKRKQALAVCLDEENGDPCPTHVVPSRRGLLSEVIADLAIRERAPVEQIGGICMETGMRQGRRIFISHVRDWCEEHGWQGGAWTDLGSNYRALQRENFSLDGATAYLKTLQGDKLEEAVRYITNAPATTDTRLRRALLDDPWWREQMARYGYPVPEPAIR